MVYSFLARENCKKAFSILRGKFIEEKMPLLNWRIRNASKQNKNAHQILYVLDGAISRILEIRSKFVCRHKCPVYVVTFRYFAIKSVAKINSKVKVTTWIGQEVRGRP